MTVSWSEQKNKSNQAILTRNRPNTVLISAFLAVLLTVNALHASKLELIGERLSLVMVLEELRGMPEERQARLIPSEPLPGFRLTHRLDDRQSGLYAVLLEEPGTGMHNVVFSGTNRPGDYLVGFRFSRTNASKQHSAALLKRVMASFELLRGEKLKTERVHFIGHSLGGSLAMLAALQFDRPHEYTVYNALGLHACVNGNARATLNGISVRSSRDMLKIWNRSNALVVPGEEVVIKRGGFHRPHPLCRAMTHCRWPEWPDP